MLRLHVLYLQRRRQNFSTAGAQPGPALFSRVTPVSRRRCVPCVLLVIHLRRLLVKFWASTFKCDNYRLTDVACSVHLVLLPLDVFLFQVISCPHRITKRPPRAAFALRTCNEWDIARQKSGFRATQRERGDEQRGFRGTEGSTFE